LALEQKIDPRKPVFRQKERLFSVFGASPAHKTLPRRLNPLGRREGI
jgi:hypothetical protein